MLYISPSLRYELTTSMVIGTDCIGSCKSNYHTITTMTAPGVNLGEGTAKMLQIGYKCFKCYILSISHSIIHVVN